jgi:hypothetical protein
MRVGPALSTFLPAPIFVSFALDGRGGRVLAFDPNRASDRSGTPSRFDTIPSEPSLQAWQKNLRAAALRDFDPANDRYGS